MPDDGSGKNRPSAPKPSPKPNKDTSGSRPSSNSGARAGPRQSNRGFNYSNTGGSSDDNSNNPSNAIGQKDQRTIQAEQMQAEQAQQQQIQQQQRQEQQQRQQQSGLYPGLSNYEGIPKNVPDAAIIRQRQQQSGLYPGLSNYEGIPKNVPPRQSVMSSEPPTGTGLTKQRSPPTQKFVLFKNDKRSAREQMAAQSGYDISPKKTNLQGPNQKEDVFFVGSNAQGFTMETQRPIEPRVTSSDLFGSNSFTRRLDKIYELDKPVSQRSDKPRPGDPIGFSNRELGELSAPFLNRASEAKDTFVATGEALQGKKSFEWEKGFLGIPNYAPVKKSPKIETTLDKIIQGKPVNLSDKNQRFSLYGSAFEFAGELKAFNLAVKTGPKINTAIQGQVMKSKTAQAAKLTSEGKEYGITKYDERTFLIAKGTEGRTGTISNKISPSLYFGKVKGKLGGFLTQTPKQVNTLSSGEKIQTSIAKIDKDIEKLKPFTNTNRFNSKLVSKTNKQIQSLQEKRAKLESNLPTAVFPGPAQKPVSIVEFGRPSEQFPKGNVFTEFGKPAPLKDTPKGTRIIVQGEVPSATLKEFGLKELPSFVSNEFGIATKSKPLYGGTVNEMTISKLINAEQMGFIKPIATGRSAPLEAILKKQGDVLRGYSGSKTMTQSISAPNMGFGASESFGIVNPKVLPRGVTGYGSKGLKNILKDLPKPESIEIGTGFGKQNKKFRPFDFNYLKEGKGIGGSTGKAQSISLKDATKAAENYLSSRPAPLKSDMDILFSAPRFLTPQYQGSMSEDFLIYPTERPFKSKQKNEYFTAKPKSKSFFQDEIALFVNPKSNSKQKQKAFAFPKFSFKDSIGTMLVPKQTPQQRPRQTPAQKPFQGFDFDNDVTTITTTIPRLDVPTDTPPYYPPPQPRPITEIPPPRFGFPPFVPGAYFGSGGYESPASLKKGFAAFGISSDINIKTLPTYSRYSAGTSIFKEQAKEDIKIQNLFYGKPRRKSSKKKSSSKKKGRKRR